MIEDNKINKLPFLYVKQNCLMSSTHLDLVVCEAYLYILMLLREMKTGFDLPALTASSDLLYLIYNG